jgi:hypothetical protein
MTAPAIRREPALGVPRTAFLIYSPFPRGLQPSFTCRSMRHTIGLTGGCGIFASWRDAPAAHDELFSGSDSSSDGETISRARRRCHRQRSGHSPGRKEPGPQKGAGTKPAPQPSDRVSFLSPSRSVNLKLQWLSPRGADGNCQPPSTSVGQRHWPS